MSTTRTSDRHLDDVLRRLDVAPAVPLGEVARSRADASLERALLAGRARSGGRDPLLPRPRRAGRRLVALGAAASLAAVGLTLSQLPGGSGTAYAASWEPVPGPVGEADADAALHACSQSPDAFEGRPGDFRRMLAERRGDLVALVLEDDRAISVTCLVDLPPGGSAQSVATSGGGGWRPGPRDLADPGVYQQGARGEELSMVSGPVGEQVAEVVVHAGAFEVRATVENGFYAAWWPGLALREDTGAASRSPGEDPFEPIMTYDVTYTDGTVVRDLQPATP